MKKVLFVFLSISIFTGCFSASSQFRVSDTIDPVTKEKSLFSFGNGVETESPKSLYIDIIVYNKDTPQQEVAISAYYSGPEWIFILPGKTLTFNVDGEVLTFTTTKLQPDRSVSKYGTVRESVLYAFDKTKFDKILTGQKIIGRVSGSKGSVDFTFTAENQNNIKSVIEKIKF